MTVGWDEKREAEMRPRFMIVSAAALCLSGCVIDETSDASDDTVDAAAAPTGAFGGEPVPGDVPDGEPLGAGGTSGLGGQAAPDGPTGDVHGGEPAWWPEGPTCDAAREETGSECTRQCAWYAGCVQCEGCFETFATMFEECQFACNDDPALGRVIGTHTQCAETVELLNARDPVFVSACLRPACEEVRRYETDDMCLRECGRLADCAVCDDGCDVGPGDRYAVDDGCLEACSATPALAVVLSGHVECAESIGFVAGQLESFARACAGMD
jgi:hypothetical protein